MYLEHYGLREPPFSITPDPRFVFLSERHRDALAHLLFGVDKGGGGGFVQLTGEVGTGKTTLSRLLLEQLPDNVRVALVLNPRLSPVELLETICEELHLDLDAGSLDTRRGSMKSLVDLLNGYLLDAYAAGLRVVLIIDEAQNLSIDALEQVRLLTNLETDTQKLLQIILIGQPELRTMLARPDLRQLAQRITARYHLTPLSLVETGNYLRHRYRVAGGTRLAFTHEAIKRIHRHAGGVPRLINVVAERALLGGYAGDLTTLDARWIDRAAREALAPARRRRHGWNHATAALLIGVIVALGFWWHAHAPIAPRSLPAPATVQAATVATMAAPVATAAPATLHLDDPAFDARLSGSNPSPASAWQRLLVLWQLPPDAAAVEAAAACRPVVTAGVYCLRGRSGLDKLVAQGRPVLLHLHSGGQESWAVLLGADGVNVRVWLDDAIVDVGRMALERAWHGEYAALWRAPDYLAAPLSSRAQGPAVEWIRDRLAPRYMGADALAVLDASMIAGVRRFQAARGLVSDGAIGPQTLMALAAGDAGPRLSRTLE